MPGRGSYGSAGKWVHDRAHHIMGKNPEMPKGMAYAIATQQGHKVGKSAKKHRTKEGLRVARVKYSLPRKMYKKTASAYGMNISQWLAKHPTKGSRDAALKASKSIDEAAEKLLRSQRAAAKERSKRGVTMSMAQKTGSDKRKEAAFARLKKLQKEAETKRGPVTKGSFTIKKKRRTPKRVRIPAGMEAVRRGKMQQRVLGGAPFKVQPVGTPSLLRRIGEGVGERALAGAGEMLSSRIANMGAAKAAPAAAGIGASALDAAVQPSMASGASSSKGLLKNPAVRKALRYGGIGALGLGLGAGAHQLAQSVGLTDTGPSDVLADIVVPSRPKYSHDIEATKGLGEGNMYIPRYFLEKAAASMAGAMEDNEGDMHEGEPGMFGPEASVIPQQTLETAVPIMQHVDKSDEEADAFIQRMFSNYKATKEESVGRYTKGETIIPLEKQAGRLLV